MKKRLIVCCDGTWNTPDQKEGGEYSHTNVAKLALGAKPHDVNGTEQLVYYNKGVGTGRFDHMRGGALGWGLSRNIQEAYIYLLRNYEPGDEIFLFGFSRGAYTVRSLAGLIRNSGLLKPNCEQKLEDAYDLYRDRAKTAHPRSVESQLFRKSYSYDVRIKFIGVWDTVGALGIPNLASIHHISKRWTFHDVTLSTTVDNAYQALAIDERRKPFIPTLWKQQREAVGQKLEQVWFAGVHSNIGGGYLDVGLSDLALEWMAGKALTCGLALDLKLQPNPYGLLRNSMTWYYKFLGQAQRQIHIPDPDPATDIVAQRASIHESVFRRLRKPEMGYTPQNLIDYLNQRNPPG